MQHPAAPGAATDIPELLAMEQLAQPERLLLGYFLGRVTRPAQPGGAASPLALQLATHPAGQEFFVESFVDLAHLTSAFGEVLATYLQHKHTPDSKQHDHTLPTRCARKAAAGGGGSRRRAAHTLATMYNSDGKYQR